MEPPAHRPGAEGSIEVWHHVPGVLHPLQVHRQRVFNPLGACSLILIWVILFLISHNMETFPYKSQARRRWCPAEASSPVAAQAKAVAV